MKEPIKRSESDKTERDNWARFERAVDVVAKSPPQHRVKPKAKENQQPTKKEESR